MQTLRLVLMTCITALNNVTTCGESSLENLMNTIKNLKVLVKTIEQMEEEAKPHDADDGQGQDV